MNCNQLLNIPQNELLARDKAVVWHPYGRDSDHECLLPISHGDGALLITDDGRSIIDAIASWWVNIHGHAHPYLQQAIADQAKKLSQPIFGSCTHEPAVRLAERLLEILPSNQSCVFYSDDGSTAVEVAIKLAIQYWRNKATPRTRLLALEGAYHGDTFGAMSVSERGVFNTAFSPLLFDVDFIPFPGSPDDAARCLEQELAKQPVAALIVEPLVQGAAGMRMYDSNVLEKMMQVCRGAQTLIIFDEVMTGFGRTGSLFACSNLTNKPDLICLSKGITGGLLPLGVTTMTSEIRETCRSEDNTKTFFHGHSFTGNALSCASALASLDLLELASCTEARSRINDHHKKFAEETESRFPSITPRVCGTHLAIDFPNTQPTGYTNPLRHYLLREFLKDNILLRPLGNTVYVLPPYCISDEQLALVYQSINRVLDLVMKKWHAGRAA